MVPNENNQSENQIFLPQQLQFQEPINSLILVYLPLMKSHFLKFSACNAWENQKLLTYISGQNASEECFGKFSHIQLAEKVWLSRLNGNPLVGVNIFESLPFESLNGLMTTNNEIFPKLISGLDDFGATIMYRMLNGTETKSTIAVILAHIFNHGT